MPNPKKKIYTDKKLFDKANQAYQDSLTLYNGYIKANEKFKKEDYDNINIDKNAINIIKRTKYKPTHIKLAGENKNIPFNQINDLQTIESPYISIFKKPTTQPVFQDTTDNKMVNDFNKGTGAIIRKNTPSITPVNKIKNTTTLTKIPTRQPIKQEVNIQPTEEAQYQSWRSKLPKNLQYEGDYDLKGFWKENPTWTPDNTEVHMTDKFKLPNHPTFSNESKYYKPGMKAVRWEGDTPIPIQTQKYTASKYLQLKGKASGYINKGDKTGIQEFGNDGTLNKKPFPAQVPNAWLDALPTEPKKPVVKKDLKVLSNIPKSQREAESMIQSGQIKVESYKDIAARKAFEKAQELKDRQERLAKSESAKTKPLSAQQFADETGAIGDKLRISQKPNFFDDYINPAVMIGDMASSLGKLPLNIKKGNYGQAALSVATPLVTGAIGGVEAKNTKQFVNNLANPLAGTGELIDNLGNKYLPNAYKLNPLAKKAESFNNPNSFYRQIDEETFKEGLKSRFIKGKQNVNKTQGENIINLNKSFGDDAYYKKGSLYSPQRADYVYEVNKGEEFFIPKVNNKTKGYTVENTPIRVSKEPISLTEANVYKKDWLQGYKKVPKLKTGTENITNNVKNKTVSNKSNNVIHLENVINKAKKENDLGSLLQKPSNIKETPNKFLYNRDSFGNLTANKNYVEKTKKSLDDILVNKKSKGGWLNSIR